MRNLGGYLVRAQQDADYTGLPQTLYATNDPDMPFFQGACLGQSPWISTTYRCTEPVLTVLPARYFT